MTLLNVACNDLQEHCIRERPRVFFTYWSTWLPIVFPERHTCQATSSFYLLSWLMARIFFLKVGDEYLLIMGERLTLQSNQGIRKTLLGSGKMYKISASGHFGSYLKASHWPVNFSIFNRLSSKCLEISLSFFRSSFYFYSEWIKSLLKEKLYDLYSLFFALST